MRRLRLISFASAFALITLVLAPFQWLFISIRHGWARSLPLVYHRMICRLMGVSIKSQGTIRRTNINHDWPPVEITLFIIFESAKMSSRKNLSVPMKKNATLEDRAEDAAALLLAMANPRRLLVLCSLLEKERSAGDLAEVAAISAAALSQHLTKMRAQGLLKSRRDGQTIYYSLAGSEVRAILQTLYGLFCASTK